MICGEKDEDVFHLCGFGHDLLILPEESRSRLLLKPSLALLRLSEADEAAKFEFRTVGIWALLVCVKGNHGQILGLRCQSLPNGNIPYRFPSPVVLTTL